MHRLLQGLHFIAQGTFSPSHQQSEQLRHTFHQTQVTQGSWGVFHSAGQDSSYKNA